MGLVQAAAGESNDPATTRRVARPRHAPSGLVSLLSHDLRVPLGPLALATSSLAADPSLTGAAKEFAQIANAQAAKLGRLVGAALAASGRLPTMRARATRLTSLLDEAAEAFAALGGRVAVDGDVDASLAVDPRIAAELILNLLELAAGGRYETSLHAALDGPGVLLTFACDDARRCAEAFASPAPADADAAFALSSARLVADAGGTVALEGARLLVWLPCEGSA